MSRKLLMIRACADCPHHEFDRQDSGPKFWGKHWCRKLDVELPDDESIPAFCPLSDYEPGEPQPKL